MIVMDTQHQEEAHVRAQRAKVNVAVRGHVCGECMQVGRYPTGVGLMTVQSRTRTGLREVSVGVSWRVSRGFL